MCASCNSGETPPVRRVSLAAADNGRFQSSFGADDFVRKIRIGRSWIEAIDLDVMIQYLPGKRLDKSNHGAFRSGVSGKIELRRRVAIAGEDDDFSGSSFGHPRQNGAARVRHAQQIDLDCICPGLPLEFAETIAADRRFPQRKPEHRWDRRKPPRARSTASVICSGSVTSARIRSAFPPACSISMCARSISALLRPTNAIFAPSLANPSATRLPIPLPAPVTRMFFFGIRR